MAKILIQICVGSNVIPEGFNGFLNVFFNQILLKAYLISSTEHTLPLDMIDSSFRPIPIIPIINASIRISVMFLLF